MSKMSDLFVEIQELIENTEMSFPEIAKSLDVPLEMVFDVADELGEFDE